MMSYQSPDQALLKLLLGYLEQVRDRITAGFSIPNALLDSQVEGGRGVMLRQHAIRVISSILRQDPSSSGQAIIDFEALSPRTIDKLEVLDQVMANLERNSRDFDITPVDIRIY